MLKQKDLQLMIMLLLGCSGYLHRASTAGPRAEEVGSFGHVMPMSYISCCSALLHRGIGWHMAKHLNSGGFLVMEVFSLFDLCPEREIRVGMSKGLRILRSEAISQPLFHFVVCLGYMLLPPTCTKTHLMPYAEWISAAGAVSTNTRMGSDASFHLPALGFHTLQHLRKLTLVYLKILARSA